MSETKHPDGEPWEWSEATWRKIVGRARAGRSLAPKAWPDGARCAFAVSFDADHDTIPLRDSDESPMRISQGQYGNRQAVPRIMRLLERESIPASFFYPAVSALLYPDEVRAVAGGRARDRHPLLDPRGQYAAAAGGRARPDLPGRRHAGEARGQAAGGHADGELGLLGRHDGHHPRARAAVRQLADGRRRSLRAGGGRRADRRGRAAAGMDPRRRGRITISSGSARCARTRRRARCWRSSPPSSTPPGRSVGCSC